MGKSEFAPAEGGWLRIGVRGLRGGQGRADPWVAWPREGGETDLGQIQTSVPAPGPLRFAPEKWLMQIQVAL